ncbi:ABC transporter permease [Novosphingobium album (ex Liu et al. 2023)]|uniref:FtsX-like permease family protein n=1 Tax=Novosphingobium album (ex Liu et al. 2023) TaxID=3031130 RepID=A0ABT5WNN0_9SPHN|nr:FtsX-like permease family protein [Novosphingobium album (ex Liu et al. 2023)]MDE8650877.1 FtsX-like permease family protein [Novosphingobium album (ex Liu et al. 2023)]
MATSRTTRVDSALSWRTAWMIARRDLSARFRGLRLLLVCLFLGVGAIAAIGTLTGSIERELATRGRQILGGDLEVRVWQRGLSPAEMGALERLGTVSMGLRMQAIAQNGDLTAPVALKAVDAKWPLYGTLLLKDGRKVRAPPEGTIWLSEGTAARLQVAPGSRVSVSGQPLTVGGIIQTEPELLGEGFSLGDVAIVTADMPARAGLTAPGAMYRTKVRVALPASRDPQALAESIERQFPDAGFEFRTRDKAAPNTERFVSRMGEFLVLVGLAALVIAGIGIGGGVSSYLEARRASIATLKVLGATSGDIARIYLLQIAAAALAGSLAGLAAGVLVTPLLARALGTLLPVSAGFTVSPVALFTAAGYGLLVALIFAAPPLARARAFPAMALMRARVSPLRLGRGAWLLPVGLGLVAIVALALANAAQPRVTLMFLGGAAAMLLVLAGVGWAIRAGVARLPRPKGPMLRAGLANLYRPGAQTGALVTALGFGLSAFVLIAAVQTSLDANIRARVPQRAPDYFVLDVPRERADEFRRAVTATVPRADVRMVPNLRGRILAYGPAAHMTRVSDLAEIPDDAWPLRGERGLTYAAALPEGNVLTDGAWWPRDYKGPPLVSVDEEFARAIHLKVGDELTIGLLGVERAARIASLRRIDWDSMGFNFVLVFSPNALADAPHNLAATIDLPPGTANAGLLQKLVRAFPSSSVIETGGLLRDARDLLGQMSTAILAAASVAVLAGLAVLFGAIAAARASRTYDNVILRVLGASRGQLLALQLAEYGLIAAILALVSLAIGSVIGWAVIVQLFEFDWLPDWPRVIAVLGAGLVLIIAFALAGSLPLLRAKPAQALREL